MKGETKRRNADKPVFDNPHDELAYHKKRAGIAQAIQDQLRALLKVANQDSTYHRNMVQKYQHQIEAFRGTLPEGCEDIADGPVELPFDRPGD